MAKCNLAKCTTLSKKCTTHNFKENYFELIIIYSFIYINTLLGEMQPGEIQFGEMQLSQKIYYFFFIYYIYIFIFK